MCFERGYCANKMPWRFSWFFLFCRHGSMVEQLPCKQQVKGSSPFGGPKSRTRGVHVYIFGRKILKILLIVFFASGPYFEKIGISP